MMIRQIFQRLNRHLSQPIPWLWDWYGLDAEKHKALMNKQTCNEPSALNELSELDFKNLKIDRTPLPYWKNSK